MADGASVIGHVGKVADRDTLEVRCILTGGGLGVAPVLTASGAPLIFDTATRSAAGKVTLPLKTGTRFTACKITGQTFAKSDYDTTAARKKLILVSEDVQSAGTIIFRVEEEGLWQVDEWTNPLAAAAAGLKAATATTVAPQTILAAALLTAGKDELAARPRNVTFTTAGGTPADAPATVVITGTDIDGEALTETVNVAQTATIAEGVKAFKTITSIVYAAGDGTNATVAIGYGNKFGLSRKAKTRTSAVMRGTEIAAGSVVTNGTLVVASTGAPNGTYTPNTAPDGANDYAIAYERDNQLRDLLTTEKVEFTMVLSRAVSVVN